MTAFLSTYVNRVDRKGRVSVPAAYRAALAGSSFQGIIGYASLTLPAIEAIGRDVLDQMSNERLNRSLAGGEFERALLGGDDDGLIETIAAMVRELPFDGEGRIILPAAFAEHAGIDTHAAFVGRGSRFQIWQPEAFDRHQAEEVERLRARLGGEQRR